MNRVVITGLGTVNALGVGVEHCWSRLLAAESGIRPMQRIDPTGLRNVLAGEVPEDEWQGLGHFATLSRPAGYARCAAEQALAQAGWPLDRWTVGTVWATNFGEQQQLWTADNPAARAQAASFSYPGSAQYDLIGGGPFVTLSNACSSGTQALGHAADLVRLGRCEAALAVAFDELGSFCLSGLSILHTVSADTIRPFDHKRSGTIFGEGAGALFLETLDGALARGATPLAEVLGYGVNNNAYHMTAPDKGGEGMVAVIQLALRQAGLDPARIGHVNAHATGTEFHDPAETAALKTVLGAHAYAIPVSAIKAATGHAMGAAGAIEAVVTVLALRDQVAPPTLNLDEPDALCDLDCTPGAARPASFDVALSVSAGLGGNNAAVLLGRLA